MAQMVYKVILGTKKEVLLRELQIKHQDLAMQAVGSKAGENQFLFGSMMQKELLKILVVQVNGKDLPAAELEQLDALFSYPEYLQLMSVMKQLMGDAEAMGKFQIEHVSYGSK